VHTKHSTGRGIHYTVRGVHTKHCFGGGHTLYCQGHVLNIVLGRGEDIHCTARGVQIKHSAGRGRAYYYGCQASCHLPNGEEGRAATQEPSTGAVGDPEEPMLAAATGESAGAPGAAPEAANSAAGAAGES
jgi:hypothetical protein